MTRLTSILCGFFLTFLICNPLLAQITNTDCIGATPICTNIYVENIVPDDEGFFPEEINPDISCTDVEVKNIWYTFTVNRTGEFGFLIQPNDPGADYDWALYDLTNATCIDIFFNPDLLVSCNAAGTLENNDCNGDTGATGATPYSIQGGGCYADNPDITMGRNTFNDLIDVFAGNTYVLTVSNWNENPGGYMIDFSPSGDIGIIDNVNPSIATTSVADNCFITELDIRFSENIQCSTINVENVLLDGVGTNISSISSAICAEGGFSASRFKILFNEALDVTGSYDLVINSTTQYPVNDLCDNSIGNDASSFRIENDGDAPILVNVEPDDPCQINALTVNFSQPILCSGVTTNSFTVTGPTGVLPGATRLDNCMSTSTSFVYELDQPIIDNGEYQLFINRVPGFDITNECLKVITGAEGTDFRKDSQDGANIETVGWNDDCAIQELQITFSQPILCNTISNNNLSVQYLGAAISGTIVDSNCDSGSPMSLTQVTYELDQQIDVNGDYSVELLTNGIDEVLTICGTPSQSGSRQITVDLVLDAPQVTAVAFPDSCNIQTMTLSFSKPVNCATAQGGNVNLSYGTQNISVSPLSTNCDMTQMIEFDLASVINSNAEYTIDFVESSAAFTDVCGVSTESNSLVGDLSFNDCDSCFIYIPNAFTPNGDTVNDGIGPFSNCGFASVSMLVFDRWGNLVFESRGADDLNWDGLFKGETIDRGVYAYIIEIELREFRRSSTRTRKGTFTVM